MDAVEKIRPCACRDLCPLRQRQIHIRGSRHNDRNSVIQRQFLIHGSCDLQCQVFFLKPVVQGALVAAAVPRIDTDYQGRFCLRFHNGCYANSGKQKAGCQEQCRRFFSDTFSFVVIIHLIFLLRDILRYCTTVSCFRVAFPASFHFPAVSALCNGKSRSADLLPLCYYLPFFSSIIHYVITPFNQFTFLIFRQITPAFPTVPIPPAPRKPPAP